LQDQWVIEETKREIKEVLDSNENAETNYQNLWNTGKAVLRGKFIAMSTHIRKLERVQINNLMVHLKLLENKNKPT
jgi:hypothetical protein